MENNFYSKHIGREYVRNSFHAERSISEENKKAVDDFITKWRRQEDIGDRRVAKYYTLFRILLKLAGKDFKLAKASEEALEKLADRIKDSEYAEWTKSDLRALVKRYYTFLNNGEAPSKVKWIKVKEPKPKHKTSEELISREELEKLISVCQNTRDPALLMTLHEGGLRAGEMSVLKKNSISFDEDGMWIDIPDVPGVTKTGGRKIPLIETEPYMKAWLNAHPSKFDSAPLWVKIEQNKTKAEPLDYNSMRIMVLKKAKLAQVDLKKVNLHNFRHSSASDKASKGWTKAALDAFFGWTPNSNTSATYVHMQNRDVMTAMRRALGLPTEEKVKAAEKITCQRCGRINDPEARFCTRCQVPLSLAVAVEKSTELQDRVTSLEKQLERIAAALELNNHLAGVYAGMHAATKEAARDRVTVEEYDYTRIPKHMVKKAKEALREG